jgi:2-polyprenyl-3-methyl-5-hydroxy-6-metoxy-1,4-benzoquinol methylase
MTDQNSPFARTDEQYWERTWFSSEVPRPVDLNDRSLRNHATLALHAFFEQALAPLSGRGGSLIELGCAHSKWLPYFAQRFGLQVAGLDYVESGCETSRNMLQAAGVTGTIVHGDVFNPPRDLAGRFDVVYSAGLVEHFESTADAISACAAFAKPGGLIVTIIPNLTGLIGILQRVLDRQIYDKHIVLGPDQLRAAHETAGLTVLDCRYLLSANFAIMNHPAIRPMVLNKAVRGGWIAATLAVWLLEYVVTIPPSRLLSPYVVCVARYRSTASASTGNLKSE